MDEKKEDAMEYGEIVKYVNNSSYRVKVMKVLSDGEAKMPKDIAKDSKILPNHISNVLTQLRKKELLECINPEYKKGRLYRLTDDGKNMMKDIK